MQGPQGWPAAMYVGTACTPLKRTGVSSDLMSPDLYCIPLNPVFAALALTLPGWTVAGSLWGGAGKRRLAHRGSTHHGRRGSFCACSEMIAPRYFSIPVSKPILAAVACSSRCWKCARIDGDERLRSV